jgi:hypothetical protein
MSWAPFQDLNVPHEKQQMGNDCWATCLLMIFRWRGFKTTKEDILNKAESLLKGNGYQAEHLVEGKPNGGMANCQEAAAVASSLSNRQIRFTIINRAQYSARQFRAYLDLHLPIMVSMNNHMRVVYGYTNDETFLINDPGQDPPAAGKKIAITFTAKDNKPWGSSIAEAAVMDAVPVAGPAAKTSADFEHK